MRVLQIIKTNEGATWAYNQAKWLHNHGVEVITVLPNIAGGMADKYVHSGMQVIQGDFSLPLNQPWVYFRRAKSLVDLVSQLRPDLIHFHFVTNVFFARLVLRRLRIPRVFQVPGPLHLENIITRTADILLAQKSDFWVGACKKTVDTYLHAGVSPERVFLSYYGGYGGYSCDEYEVNSKILHKQYRLSENAILIGMVSYFYKPKWYLFQKRGIKGHEDFIDAISYARHNNPDIVGVIVGGPWGNSTKYEERVRKYAQETCPNGIIFTGFRNDIKSIYREFRVAIHPSHSENLGGAAESLAAAVPTIATNVGGFPDIIEHGRTGYLVNPKKPQELGQMITQVLGNYDQAIFAAMQGQNFVRELLDMENTGTRITWVYNRVIGVGNE